MQIRVTTIRASEQSIQGIHLVAGLGSQLTLANLRRTLASTMSMGFDEAFKRVKQLATDFRANEKFYLSPACQEQEARRDFIDKFRPALGWSMNHETRKNPFEQEVNFAHEL